MLWKVVDYSDEVASLEISYASQWVNTNTPVALPFDRLDSESMY
jgi:hypothetical protein